MKKLVFWLLTLLMAWSIPESCLAKEQPGRVFLIVIDKLNITDISSDTTPELYRMANNGALGVASTRTLNSINTEDECLTIGAGNLAQAYASGIEGYNAEEVVEYTNHQAYKLYENLTGFKAGNNKCFLINWAEIENQLVEEHVSTRLGALGEALRRHGILICLLGNGDTLKEKQRASLAIAMDAEGRVPLGDIGVNTTRFEPDGILSKETNYDYIWDKVQENRDKAGLIIIDLSDLARLEKSRVPAPEQMVHERNRILGNIDAFVGRLVNSADKKRDLVMVIAPSPSREQSDLKNVFTPVIAWGHGFHKGILTSAATRRNGIITNTDIAPTILHFFNIKDEDKVMIGQPAAAIAVSGQSNLTLVQRMVDGAATTNRLRLPLVRGYVIWQIIVIVLTVLGAVLVRPNWFVIAKPAVLSIAVVPCVFLFLGKLNLTADWMYIIIALAGTFILTLLLALIFDDRYLTAFAVITVITVLALNIDLVTGGTLIQSSVLGYDPMAGARYYGIGNEYMGIIVGGAIIVGAILFQKVKRKWVLLVLPLFYALQCIMICAPGLGANSDGMITAPLAFAITLLLITGVRIKPQTLATISILLAIIIVGATAYDMSRPPDLQTHIGRAAEQVLSGGPSEAATIIFRKAEMNIKLIKYTVWTRVLLVILAAFSVFMYFPRGVMMRIRDANPVIFKGLFGILIAAAVGLVINDSGIVVAATTSIYLAVPVLLMVMDEIEKKTLKTGLNQEG